MGEPFPSDLCKMNGAYKIMAAHTTRNTSFFTFICNRTVFRSNAVKRWTFYIIIIECQNKAVNLIWLWSRKRENFVTTLHCLDSKRIEMWAAFVVNPYSRDCFLFRTGSMENVIVPFEWKEYGNDALCLRKMIKNSMNSYSMVWWRWTCIVSGEKMFLVINLLR